MATVVSETTAQSLLGATSSRSVDAGEAQVAPVSRKYSWKTFWHLFLAGTCIYDVVGDLTVTRVFIHDTNDTVKKLGGLCLLCIFLTVPANFCALRNHRKKFPELYVGMQKKAPRLDNFFHLLGLSQPEIMILGLEFGRQHLSKSLMHEATKAIRDLKQVGFWAQCREDAPQFILQWAGVIVQLMDGEDISPLVWLSLGGTSLMLFVKTLMNLLVCVINAEVTDHWLMQKAEEARWSTDLNLSTSEWSHFAFQALVTIADFVFAVLLSAEKEPLLGPLSYQAVAFGIFGATYLLGVGMTLRFIRNHRDWLWPLLLVLERSAGVVAVSGVHFQIVAGVIHSEGRDLLQHDRGLLVAPMMRVVSLGALLGYCIWKTEFAVSERLLIVLAVANFVAVFHMLMLVDSAGEVQAGPPDSFRISIIEESDKEVLMQQRKRETEIDDAPSIVGTPRIVDDNIELRRELHINLVPDAPFEGMNIASALRVTEDWLQEHLPDPRDRTAYLKWKTDRLEGENVTEDLVGLDLIVKRGAQWHYDPDSSDDEAPEDGGKEGRGVVVGFKTSCGRSCGRSADDIPEVEGWTRVRWQATGYHQTYRLGSSGRDTELKFAKESKRSLKSEATSELRPYHLRPTFGYKLGINFPHYALFDVDPAACQKVGGFRPGDRVKAGNKLATCIGLHPRGKKTVSLFFHFDEDDGAGTFRRAEELKKVGHVTVEPFVRPDDYPGSDSEIPHDVQSRVTETLQDSFDYMTRADFPISFDDSREKVKKFNLPFGPGDVLIDLLDSEQMQCIGVACDPARRHWAKMGRKPGRFKGSQAEVWFHVLTDPPTPGAGVCRNIHKNFHRYRVLPGEIKPFPRSGDRYTPERTKALLKQYEAEKRFRFDQRFPRGGYEASFDMNSETLKEITGYEAGQRLTLKGGKKGNCWTLVGVANNHGVNELEVFWHYEDRVNLDAGAKPWAAWEHCKNRMQVLQDGKPYGRQHLAELAKRIREHRQTKAGAKAAAADESDDLLKMIAMLDPKWQLPQKADNLLEDVAASLRRHRHPEQAAADRAPTASAANMPEEMRSTILAGIH